MERADFEIYSAAREQLKEEQRLRKELGFFKPERAFLEEVMLEFQFSWHGQHPFNVLGMLSEWKRTKNPHFVDAIQLYCDANDLTIGPILNGVFVEVAKKRFNSSLSGTPENVAVESAENHVYKFMLNMVYHGLPLKVAASKAAKWHSLAFKNLKPFKASTLEKYYVKKFRRCCDNGFSEREFFDTWNKEKELDFLAWEANRKAWLKIIDVVPLCDDVQLGSRR